MRENENMLVLLIHILAQACFQFCYNSCFSVGKLVSNFALFYLQGEDKNFLLLFLVHMCVCGDDIAVLLHGPNIW